MLKNPIWLNDIYGVKYKILIIYLKLYKIFEYLTMICTINSKQNVKN